MRSLIVDDHALFREGLGLLLKQLEPAAELELVPDADLAITKINNIDFDLILLDWNLNGLTGADALNLIHEYSHSARIIILSAERDTNLIRKCIDLGASGFIHKDSSPDLLISAMRLILSGGVFLPNDAFFNISNGFNQDTRSSPKKIRDFFPELTPRQINVLEALVRGLANKRIARELDITQDTVKQHLSAIYRILNVENRTQAVYILAKHQLNVE